MSIGSSPIMSIYKIFNYNFKVINIFCFVKYKVYILYYITYIYIKMNFSILLLNNFELFIPEIFFITSIVLLILYSGLIYSNLSILTLYTNKIASFIVFICFILNFNTYLLNHNFEIFQYNFVVILKLIILFSVFCCLIFTENFILQSFEFSFLILLSSLGFILLILSFDLILLYLAIEIQSISFYILNCLKKFLCFQLKLF